MKIWVLAYEILRCLEHWYIVLGQRIWGGDLEKKAVRSWAWPNMSWPVREIQVTPDMIGSLVRPCWSSDNVVDLQLLIPPGPVVLFLVAGDGYLAHGGYILYPY